MKLQRALGCVFVLFCLVSALGVEGASVRSPERLPTFCQAFERAAQAKGQSIAQYYAFLQQSAARVPAIARAPINQTLAQIAQCLGQGGSATATPIPAPVQASAGLSAACLGMTQAARSQGMNLEQYAQEIQQLQANAPASDQRGAAQTLALVQQCEAQSLVVLTTPTLLVPPVPTATEVSAATATPAASAIFQVPGTPGAHLVITPVLLPPPDGDPAFWSDEIGQMSMFGETCIAAYNYAVQHGMNSVSQLHDFLQTAFATYLGENGAGYAEYNNFLNQLAGCPSESSWYTTTSEGYDMAFFLPLMVNAMLTLPPDQFCQQIVNFSLKNGAMSLDWNWYQETNTTGLNVRWGGMGQKLYVYWAQFEYEVPASDMAQYLEVLSRLLQLC